MNAIDEEKSVLRWGGLAGILGSIVFVLVFVVVIAFVGPEPAVTEGEVMRFPTSERRAQWRIASTWWFSSFGSPISLPCIVLCGGTSLAPARFGSVLGIVGLGVLAAGALPHVATAPISDLYHAPGATTED
jgi:hypothetical protein